MFQLSPFQEISINAIKDGHHSLVCAGTGSGKTLPAEYSIRLMKEKGLKVIYTSPIKALSNQKYYDFKRKFPDITFGLITGDIKIGPNADVIIMTCEILRNSLFRESKEPIRVVEDFELNLNEIGLVIFDEIHYINDYERGHVWEECLLKLSEKNLFEISEKISEKTQEKPPEKTQEKKNSVIQFLMLSATLDDPESFANYISSMSENKIPVILSQNKNRVVPLEHYSLTFYDKSTLKKFDSVPSLKGKLSSVNKILLKQEGTGLLVDGYHKVSGPLSLINKNFKNFKSNKTYIINETVKFLKKENLLPAIFFSLSRKNVMYYASLVETHLNDFSEESEKKILNNEVRNEVMNILRRIPNYNEYTCLPEFENLVKLLEKGIGYHHSGLLSIFREIVELMFEKGYVKLLFATETFSVGINLPTKATVFDSLKKFDGNENRYLFPHEYSQMSGRAGRRSIDPIGYSFHLNNLFEFPDINEYKEILSNKSQKFISKFFINYDLIFKLLKENDFSIIEKSSLTNEINKEIKSLEFRIEELKKKFEEIIIEELFNDLVEQLIKIENESSLNKKKSLMKSFESIIIEKNINKKEIEELKNKVIINNKIKNEISLLNKKIVESKSYSEKRVNECVYNLIEKGFITVDKKLTEKGIIASNIQEVHSLAFTELFFYHNCFKEESPKEICSILSILIENEDASELNSFEYSFLKEYTLIYDNISLIKNWCEATNQEACLKVINDSGIYIGSFIKIILKLNNLISEIDRITEDIELKYKLSKIPELLLKYIVNNQSLYV